MSYEEFRLDYDADRADFLGFWAQHFPAWSATKFEWFYSGNPAGPTIGCGIRRTDGQALLGCTAAFPRELHVTGRPRRAGITGDFAVHPQHRVLGPALMLQRGILAAAREEGMDILYGLPNKSSEPVQKRVGFQVIGRNVRMVRVLKSRTRLARRVDLPVITLVASKVLDLGMRLRSPETFRRTPKGLRVVLLNQFDERFDRLWHRARESFRVIGRRDHAFLAWRFGQCPHHTYRVMVLEKADDGELAGYVVFRDGDDGAGIADMLAESDSAWTPLLREFVRLSRKRGASAVVVSTFGNEEVVSRFRELRFHVETTDWPVAVGIEPDDPDADVLRDGASWFLTDCDHDV